MVDQSMRWGGRQKGMCTYEMFGHLELEGGVKPTAKHILPGVRNALANRITRWSRSVLADTVRELTNSNEYSEQHIGPRGSGMFMILCSIQLIVLTSTTVFCGISW